MQDAANLAWKLARVSRGAPTSLLDTYDEERLPHAEEVLQETDRTTTLLFAPNAALRVIRDSVILPVLRNPWFQRRMFGKFSQLHVHYRGSSLSRESRGGWWRRRSVIRAGDRAIQRRNRALIAFTILTGCRVNATASLKLKHVDVPSRSVYLDAREVRTKFSKTFTVNFFEVGDEVREIFQDWIGELRDQQLWGNDDPVFPATNTRLGPDHVFRVAGVKREHWASSSPIRGIFRAAFEAAGLPYFHPHTFRRTLVALGEAVCR